MRQISKHRPGHDFLCLNLMNYSEKTLYHDKLLLIVHPVVFARN